jgi:hypothetical protein
MKTLIFAAALTLGGAAMAQDTTAPAGGTPVAPSNAAPERDARGIPVVSAEAVAPTGYNQPAQVGPAGTLAPPATPAAMPPAGDLPPCTRKVTDHCTQTYERHRAPKM